VDFQYTQKTLFSVTFALNIPNNKIDKLMIDSRANYGSFIEVHTHRNHYTQALRKIHRF